MADQFSLFDSNLPPITWRRASVGTFWFIESKNPEFVFRIQCVTEEGKMASLEEGDWFRVTAHVDGCCKYSPLYGSLAEAKAACEEFRHVGNFPPANT